mmetsp:Transcript_114850/g.324592  ORF Transcript_114850/g.324592 Transcript_114850/m.324592 type:complete len:200 (-) Transcript_114850:3-602(-)
MVGLEVLDLHLNLLGAVLLHQVDGDADFYHLCGKVARDAQLVHSLVLGVDDLRRGLHDSAHELGCGVGACTGLLRRDCCAPGGHRCRDLQVASPHLHGGAEDQVPERELQRAELDRAAIRLRHFEKSDVHLWVDFFYWLYDLSLAFQSPLELVDAIGCRVRLTGTTCEGAAHTSRQPAVRRRRSCAENAATPCRALNHA